MYIRLVLRLIWKFIIIPYHRNNIALSKKKKSVTPEIPKRIPEHFDDYGPPRGMTINRKVFMSYEKGEKKSFFFYHYYYFNKFCFVRFGLTRLRNYT